MADFITVNDPDGNPLNFPNTMSMEEISAVMKTKFPPKVSGFKEQASKMSPIDLSIARSKNDAFADYLRAESDKPRAGESDQEAFIRKYGKISGEKEGYGTGVPRSYLQGAMLGFGDEAVAGMAAAGESAFRGRDMGDAYQQHLDYQRGQQKQFQKDAPITSTVAEIGGAIPTTALPLLNMVRGGKYAQAAGTGALEGSIYGFGTGEGDAESQLKSAATGAAIGAGTGLLPVPVTSAVKNLAQKYGTKKAAKMAGMSVPTMEIIRRAGEADEALTGAGREAIARGGPDAMLAESGKSMQSLLDVSAQTSGAAANKATQAVNQRVTKATQGLNRTIDDTLGKVGESSSRELRVFGDKTNPLNLIYKRAYSNPIDYSSKAGMELESLIKNNVPPEAINAANKLLRMEGHTSSQIMASIDDFGNVVYEKLPDTKQIDYITRGLNQTASTGEGSGALGGQTQIGAAYQNLSKRIRDNLKTANPDYKVATGKAADAIKTKQAKELGFKALSPSMSRDEFSSIIKDMDLPERKKVIEGIRINIDDTLARVKSVSSDPDTYQREGRKLLQDLSSRANREKLSMVMGEIKAAKLFNDLDKASKAFELKAGVASNSKTFAREQAAAGVRDLTEEGVLNKLREGEPLVAGRNLVQSIFGRSEAAKQQISDDVYLELVNQLTGPRGPQALEKLRQIQAAQPLIDQKTGRAVDITSLLTTLPFPATQQFNTSNSGE